MCTDDDDDEWTEVSTSQLLQPTDTADTDTQVARQHSRDAVKPSDDSQTVHMSSDPAAEASSSSSHSQQADDVSPATAAPAESYSSDVRASSVTQSSTDHDHDSLSSDNNKTDSLVIVSVTPERTSPSDESSNAKGYDSLMITAKFSTIPYHTIVLF